MTAPAETGTLGEEVHTKPMLSAEEKYNSQVDFPGARLEVLPLHSHVVPGFINRGQLLFQFVIGTNPSLEREAFSLSVVLDVSGSMQGTKLERCKKAVAQLIESAGDEDMLSLVTYDDKIKIVFENVRCGDDGARKRMKDSLMEVKADGSTDLYGGLLAGYDLLQRHEGASNKHIFLLSDGEANHGQITSTEGILRAVEAWGEKIPILSFGIGEGFNERLMSPLGQVHRGSHYFYLTDGPSIEKLMARGVRALTGAVARNVCLKLKPLSAGLWLPDHMIDGARFPLMRERSVVQFMVELEVRPELFGPEADATKEKTSGCSDMKLDWEVHGFPLLEQNRGTVAFVRRSERGPETEEVRTFLDVKRGCELRRSASDVAGGRTACEQALRLFEGRLAQDRFGFAQEWAKKTKELLEDASAWKGESAGAGAAKHLGVAYQKTNDDDDDEEEEEMDFDLFG
eukprot:TRINITY_DN3074_c3_g1_i1.p1 TRINITY_DN3074_c3_g1~~TRINITY_DN3074_c3_g1_i1.p1  ORF type:complete len:457 (-),score=68.81 TRINITY_DN3074_c3_g1_i1:87-1457(-)